MSRSGILLWNYSKCHFFGENREIGKNREIFRIFKFLWFRSIYRVKIHFLSKFCQKILIFEEVTPLSVFTDLPGHWPRFTKIAVGTFQKKSLTFEVKLLESSHLPLYALYYVLKSQNAAGGTKLHPHLPGIGLKDLVMQSTGWSRWC